MDKKLQAKWYKKLKDSGFEDIENADGTLKVETHPHIRIRALHDRENREAYYRMAADFLHTHPFKTKIERAVWEAHCDGLSVRKIAALTKIGRNLVYKFIRESRSLMRKERK